MFTVTLLMAFLIPFVFGAGGGRTTGAGNALRATLGQPLASGAASASGGLRTGFWVTPATGTTPVILADLHAAWTGEGVLISWRISGETADLTGFHVYRGIDGGAENRITPDLLTGGPDFNWMDPLPPAGVVSYRLAEIERSGGITWHGPITLTVSGPAPALALLQNRPNPFRTTTRVRFQTPVAGHASIHVHDMSGRAVAVLLDRELPAGVYEVDWNGRNAAGSRVASGVYIYRLETAAGSRALKLILLP